MHLQSYKLQGGGGGRLKVKGKFETLHYANNNLNIFIKKRSLDG